MPPLKNKNSFLDSYKSSQPMGVQAVAPKPDNAPLPTLASNQVKPVVQAKPVPTNAFLKDYSSNQGNSFLTNYSNNKGTPNEFLNNYSNKNNPPITASTAGNQNVPNQKQLKDMTVAEATAAGKLDEYNKLVSGYSQQQNTNVLPQTTVIQPTNTQQNNQPTNRNTVAPTAPTNLNQQYLQYLANTAQGNQAYADRARAIADAAGQRISDIGGQGARGQAGYLTTGTSPVAEGNAAVLAQTTAAQQRAVAEGATMQLTGNSQGLTAQNQMQSGLNQAVGFTQPQEQFGMLTNPQTGQPLNRDMVSSAVATALKLTQSGVSPQDPSVTALLEPFGFVGPLAFTQAQQALSGGGYNPQAMNAIAGQNIETGTDYAAKSVALDVPIKQLQTASSQLSNFMQKASINTDPQTWKNRTYNEWMLEIQNPLDKATFEGALAATKNYLSQIISADTGLNVNAVSADVESYSNLIKDMTGPQIQIFLDNMVKEGLTRKAEFDQTAISGLSSGTTPYLGSNQAGGQSFETGTLQQQTDSGLVQNALMNKVTSIPGYVVGLFKALF